MATTQYTGARYVPLFADPAEWSSTKQYEPLTIVLHQGNSFTSKQFVPVGVDINDANYWAETGNYNAQVEQYRQEVLRYEDSVNQLSEEMIKKAFVFENVSEMITYEMLYNGCICRTMGFYAKNDGGGAWYSVTNSGTENGVTIFKCGNFYATQITDNSINVLSCGLKNDGSSGNTEKFNTLKTIGFKDFYFPNGTYAINIVIDSSDFVIHGESSTIYPDETTQNEYATILIPESNDSVIKIDNSSRSIFNCNISDISISGNNSNIGIECVGSSYANASDRHCFKNIKINRCTYGLKATSRLVCCYFENLIVHNCTQYGFYVEDVTFNAINFVNCGFSNCGIGGVYINSDSIAVDLKSYKSINFYGCDIESNGKNVESNAVQKSGLYINGIYGVSIMGCYFEENGNSDYGSNIYIGNSITDGLSISGNLIWGSKYSIYSPAGNKTNIFVNGNKMSGICNFKANSLNAQAANYLMNVNDVETSKDIYQNNTFSGAPLLLTTLGVNAYNGSTPNCATVYMVTGDATLKNVTSVQTGKVIIFLVIAGTLTIPANSGYYDNGSAAAKTKNSGVIAYIGGFNRYTKLFES